jgi:hypothetical protein
METLNTKPEAKLDKMSDEEALRSGISAEKAAELGIEIPERVVGTTSPAEAPGVMTETPTAKEEQVKSLKSRILGLFGQAPEQVKSRALKAGEERMRRNPHLRAAYDKFLEAEGVDVAEKYKEAIGKYKYIARDKDGNFVDKTVYSVASGEATRDN